MKKTILTLIMILTLMGCASLAALPASAAVVEGVCGPEGNESSVTWTLDTGTGVLTISGEGTVTNSANGQWYYNYCNQIGTIVIEEGITAIGDSAFYYLLQARQVSIPSTVTSIGSNAFSACSLTTVTFAPNSQLRTIGSNAFSRCPLNAFVIPDSVTTLGDYAFANCIQLTELSIPDSVTSIGESCFSGCYAIKSVTVGDGLEQVGRGAFAGCDRIDTVNVTDLSAWCEVEFASADANPAYYIKRICMDGEMVKELVIPEGTERIGSYAFYQMGVLTSVSVPASVTSIGNYAFYMGNFTKLQSVTFAEEGELKSIGDYAFYNCNLIQSLTLPSKVTSVGEYAFCDCSSVETLVLPRSLEVIEAGTFWGCSKLNSVQMFDSVKTIKEYAFYSVAVEELIYCGSAAQWEAIEKDEKWYSGPTYTIYTHGDWIAEGEDTHRVGCTYCGGSESVPHNWDEGEILQAPTHTETGTKRITCVDCGHIKTVTIPREHSYGDWSKHNETHHKKECSCGLDTLYEAHSWNDGEVIASSTHTVAGTVRYTCLACGETKEESLPKDPTHSYGDWIKHNQAQHKKVCPCGEDTLYEAHSWNGGEVITSSTHTVAGTVRYTCLDCGETKDEAIPKDPAHIYGDWIKHDANLHKKVCPCGEETLYEKHDWSSAVVTPASHTATGLMRHTCSGCGTTKDEVIPEDPAHVYGDWIKHDDGQHKKVCPCGDTIYQKHDLNAGEEISAPTHTETGMMRYTCVVCDGKIDEVLPKDPKHSYDNCAKHNEKQHKLICACGEEIYDGHVWVGGEIVKPATHCETGLQKMACPDCGEEKTVVLEVLIQHEFGHWIAHDDTKHRRECPCGEVDYSEHFFGLDGTKTTCVHCGYDKNGGAEDDAGNTGEGSAEQTTKTEEVVVSCESSVTLGGGILLLLSAGAAGVCMRKKEDE